MAKVELAVDWYPTVQQAMRHDLDATVDRIAAEARTLARQRAYGSGIGGHYADQIEGHTDRWESRGLVTGFAAAHKFTSGWIEHGTVHMTGRHILEDAVRRTGLPLRVEVRRRRRRGARYRTATNR